MTRVGDDKHIEFLRNLDGDIETFKNYCIKYNTVDDIEYNINRYTLYKFGEVLPVVWVKNGCEVNEFYSSKHNLVWLFSFLSYFCRCLTDESGEVITDDPDIEKTKISCAYLTLVLSNVDGINFVGGKVFLLKKDTELVKYELLNQTF